MGKKANKGSPSVFWLHFVFGVEEEKKELEKKIKSPSGV